LKTNMQMRTRVPFVDLTFQNDLIKEEAFTRLSEIVSGSKFILGDVVAEFEEAFAGYCGARHAVGVNSGTDALMLALRALEIGPGDEVITAANTFVATLEAIVHVGARPVLVDCDPLTYNIATTKIEEKITSQTRAIIPVHLFGQPADMAPILALAREHHLFVVEDAAQASGASYQGRRAGSLGDVACFSFYPSKNLGAWGDAGAVVTSNDETAFRVRCLRDHGSVRKYEHRWAGYNSRLDTVQAAVLTVSLRYLDQWNALRQQVAHHYTELLEKLPGVVSPMVIEDATHVFHLYVVRFLSARRDEVKVGLEAQGVATGIHYPEPVHLTEAFSYLGYAKGAFPCSEENSAQMLSLPMYAGMEMEKVDYVVHALESCLAMSRAKR